VRSIAFFLVGAFVASFIAWAWLGVEDEKPPMTPQTSLMVDLRRRLEVNAGLELFTLAVYEETRAQATGAFHGWPVIGSVWLSDDDEAKRNLIEALEASVRTQPRTLSTCFVPRHGLRAHLFGGDFLDLVICFQCNDMRVFIGDPETPVDVVHGLQMPAGLSGAEAFDRIAREKGLKVEETGAERAARLEREGGR